MQDVIDKLLRRAAHTPGLISFAGGLAAPESFPRELLARAAHEAMLEVSPSPLNYEWPEGRERLRTLVAARLQKRGITCSADDLVITNGGQDALALTLSVLQPHEVRVDRHTYPGALSQFRARGIRLRTQGLSGVRYLLPGIDNPLGRVMTEAEKQRALNATWLIEDDAFAELRFAGPPASALASRARERTFHLGTFSKTLSPGLRVGWLLAPPAFKEQVREAKARRDVMASGLGEAIIERVLEGIDFDARLEELRGLYGFRCEVLVQALRSLKGVHVHVPEGGYAVWVETKLHGDDTALLALALRCGVAFDPGCMYRALPDPKAPLAFRLSFSSMRVDQMAEGVRRLANVLELAGRQKVMAPYASPPRHRQHAA